MCCSWNFYFISILLLCYQSSSETCQKGDTRSVYSECSGVSSERWQVFVSDSTNCTLPSPVKVASCDKTCGEGEILSDFTDCIKCAKGSYSPGDKLVYAWLDPGLNHEVSFLSSKIKVTERSCSQIWVDQDTVVLPADQCYNVITVSFTLLKSGTVSLSYLYTDARADLVFNLKKSNSLSCEVGVTIESLPGNQSYNWQSAQLTAPSKGRYLLEIKSTAFFNIEPESSNTVPLEPPRIGNLSVSGCAPYTKCNDCPSGSFSRKEGSSSCDLCPDNTFSTGTKCKPCPANQYSLKGAGECSEKVHCSEFEFTPVVGVCRKGFSSVSAKEIVTNKCLNTQPSQQLPCSVCQPGSEKSGNKCVFCADGTHNSGGGQCLTCSPNTISLKGMYYVWFKEIPDSWNVRCPDCWHPAGPFLLGRTINYQPIAINFGEVEFSSKVITRNVIGMFTLQFKLVCPDKCSLLIIKEVTMGDVKRREVIKEFDRSIGEDDPEVARFNVLQTASQQSSDTQQFALQLSGDGAYIHLYEANFTNTRKGGSSYCFPCTGTGCKECTSGMVYQESTCLDCDEDGGCVKCPENTYHVVSGSVLDSDYKSQCVPCPAGTLALPGSTSCNVPCHLVTPSNNTYDITSASDVIVYEQPNSFPDQFGNRFHYRYKMRICSEDGNVPFVNCIEDSVRATQICQLNVITKSNGTETISNPVVKGNLVLSMSDESDGLLLQFSSGPTPDCESVTTNLTLRCSRDHTGVVRSVENSQCRLSFLYDGPFGCRLCTDSDYTAIQSGCEDGAKNITYVKAEGVVCVGYAPSPTTTKCTAYQTSLLDSIKQFKLYVGLGVVLLLILVVGLCLLAWYSSSLKHKLDGYAQLSYAKDDNYTGVRGDNNKFVWDDSDEDEEENTVYTRFHGRNKSPGNIITEKLHKLHRTLTYNKRERVGNEDIMQLMTTNFKI